MPARRRHRISAAAALLVIGLAGCASPGAPTSHAPYVGAITGEFVDGRPLVRFPPIEVIGSRRSLAQGS